jgi:hypothetical protein
LSDVAHFLSVTLTCSEAHDQRLALKPKERRILAEFMYAANKASAHVTEDSNHKLWDNGGEVFFKGCKIIQRRVSAACSIAEARLAF